MNKLPLLSFVRYTLIEASKNDEYKQNIIPALKAIKNAGGTPLIVGGYVRDSILGISSKDMDIEVYNMSQDKLIEILQQFGRVDQVGVSFGVIKAKINDLEYQWQTIRR